MSTYASEVEMCEISHSQCDMRHVSCASRSMRFYPRIDRHTHVCKYIPDTLVPFNVRSVLVSLLECCEKHECSWCVTKKVTKYVHIQVCVYIHIRIYTCIRVCIHKYMYVLIYDCVYLYVYMHIFILYIYVYNYFCVK